MQFKQEKGYTYIKYNVEIKFYPAPGHIGIKKPDVTFDKISDAVKYVKKFKKEEEKLKEVYKDCKIYIKRTKTIVDDFVVLDGD